MLEVLDAAGLATTGAQMLEATARSLTAGIAAPDEAPTHIARRFVEFRGPASEADLAWWAKPNVTQVRRALVTAVEPARPGGGRHLLGEREGAVLRHRTCRRPVRRGRRGGRFSISGSSETSASH